MSSCLHGGFGLVAAALAAAWTFPLPATGSDGSVSAVHPASPTAVEKTAFRELTNYLFKVTGVLTKSVVEGASVDSPAIYVGATAFAASNGVDVSAMDEEAWRVKSVGGDLVIAGGGRRGTLYGVYHYLEDVLGVHWFAPTSDGDTVPHLDEPVVAGLDLSGKPAMRYRTVYYVPGSWGAAFLARNRANTSTSSYGGFKIFGGVNNCHTMYPNVGPSNVIVQLFHDHPDYFPLRNGERYCDTSRANGAAQSQFCLTSPGLRALWTACLRDRIRADVASADASGVARPLYYAIDQNDCYDGFCECSNCQAIVSREGSNAGLMLDFANHVATELKDENPDARFMMMALHSSERPPTYLTASNNVIVRLCDTTSDILRPWTNAVNAAHYGNLDAWTAHADGMSMWDYSVTYGSVNVRCLPVPTEFTYGPDIRSLWEHKGEGFFLEHEDVIASDFRDFKMWLELRLLEDPMLDVDALFTLFTDLHYGAAGPFVRQYRRRLQEAALAYGGKVSWYPKLSDHAYLQPELLLELYDVRANALAAVASDAKLTQRVEYAFLSLDRIRIVRALFYNRSAARIEGGDRLISNAAAIARYSRVFSAQRAKLGLKAGGSEEKEGITNFVEAVANTIELPVPDQFRDVADDLTLIPAAKATLSYAPVAVVVDPASPASNVVRVAIADVKAHPVASSPASYIPQLFGFPFHVSISPLHTGSLLAPSVRERFTAADAPAGYRWYLLHENVGLSQASAVTPFPGCSIPLDGVVRDNSELGQRYDVYLSVKASGADWWRVGPPSDDMVVYVDQVAIVCKKKNGMRDPYEGAETVVWTGAGREGDWNDGSNWQGGRPPSDGAVAVFDTATTITSDFALPETRLMISNAASATVTLDCRVSGRGGLDKRGVGELRLMRDNAFEGAFTARGTVDALTSSAISGAVRIYTGGAFGRKAAFFDDDYAHGHGSRLRIMAPMDVTVPVHLTGDRIQTGGISFSNVDGKRVRFLKRVWSDFRILSATSPNGAEIVFEEGAECPNYLIPPMRCLTRFNGRVAGTLHVSYSAPMTNRLAYAGNAIAAFNLNDSVVWCDVENALYNPTAAMTVSFGADAWLNLCGHDQSICRLSRAIVQNSSVNHAFGFHSPVGRPASLRLVGEIPSHRAFHGCFTGAAGLEWTPVEKGEFVFSNTVQTTCGTVEVGAGAVRVKGGAGFSRLGSLAVAADATFDVMSDASAVRVVDLTVADGGRLSLAKAEAICARQATVAGGALTNGVYSAAELPDVIVGEGTLTVGARANVWSGTSLSVWDDPDNWSQGTVPVAGEDVIVPSGTQARLTSGTSTPRFASFTVAAGATLTLSNWNTVVSADAVTVAGTVTAEGPFASAADAPAARVRFACNDFMLAETGVIDVDGKGWASGQGPGTPGGSACGAAHGGCGGITTVGTTDGKFRFGCVYDSAERPELPGSGGYGTNGSAGGGAVLIEATDTAVVDGRILASAKAATKHTAGSGGSICVVAREFSGRGELRADGGNGSYGVYPAFVWSYLGDTNSSSVRAGGGGRIAIVCERNPETAAYDGLVVSAAAGLHKGLTVGNHDKYRTEADLGTLVFGDEGIVRATLGRSLSGRLVQVSAYVHEGDLDWMSGHVRFAGDGADVTVTGDLVVSGSVSRAEIGGLHTRTNVGVFADCWGGTNLNRLTVGGNLYLLDGAALDIRSAQTNATMAWGGEVSVGGDLVVGAGSCLYPWCDIRNLGAPHFDVGGAFTVESNATVMADRRGGMGGRGGSGWMSYFRLSSSAERGRGIGSGVDAGASHGGQGGKGFSSASSATRGTVGSLVNDEWSAAHPGAGGGSGGYGEGGEGGGLVYVEAGGRIRVDGLVTADGWLGTYSSLGSGKANSGYCTYFGSGAGGGIHLKGRQICGMGTLRARGGNAISGYADTASTYGYASGAGGGGRIYIEIRSLHHKFVGTTDVSGGHAVWNTTGKTGEAVRFTAAAGGEGTVRCRSVDSLGLILYLR